MKLRGPGNISSQAPLWWMIFSNFSSPCARLAFGATISERSLHFGHNPLKVQSLIDVWRTCAAANACTAADSFVAENVERNRVKEFVNLWIENVKDQR